MSAYKLCIGNANTRYSERIYKSAYLRIPGLFNGGNHIVIGLLAKALHRADTLLVPVKVIYIGVCFNHTIIYEFFKGCF